MNDDHAEEETGWETRVAEALHQWHGATEAGLLDGLLLFRRALAGLGGDVRTANNRLLLSALAELRRRYPQDADLLQLHYQNQKSVEEMAQLLSFSVPSIYRLRREAIKRLAAVLQQMDGAAWQTRQDRAIQHAARYVGDNAGLLPIGIADQVADLLDCINHRGAPWLLSIEGMGGIGKTTLAAALLAAAAGSPQFEAFAWVSAQTQRLDMRGRVNVREHPALTQVALVTALLEQLAPQEAAGLLGQPEAALGLLRTVLRRTPHLVVIDNLETVLDVEALLPVLRTLVNPSKVVLTSRKRLVGESDIYLYPVPQLREEHALLLVRQAGAQHNVKGLAEAPDAELHPIYAAVGGNPLALLLVVGQLHLHDLDALLRDLQSARGTPVEHLYTFIYRRAWENLDAQARDVLLAMSAVKVQGDRLPIIAAISNLDTGAVSGALQQLIVLNLVYTLGDVHARRYAIHSLTRSFLIKQVAKWGDSEREM